jgi:hypothetical protein
MVQSNISCDVTEPRMLEKSLARLSQSRLQFQMQAVTLPLLLQLGTSDIRLQRVVASLLTIQAARFPALIVPVLRRFVRLTLLRVDNEIVNRSVDPLIDAEDPVLRSRFSHGATSSVALQLLATVCIAMCVHRLTVRQSRCYVSHIPSNQTFATVSTV